jgi:hypothetical protein
LNTLGTYLDLSPPEGLFDGHATKSTTIEREAAIESLRPQCITLLQRSSPTAIGCQVAVHVARRVAH